MKVAIIGAGNVGGTLGMAWAKKGHDIFFGVRHPQNDKTRQLLQSIGSNAKAGTVADAAAFGEVVVLATPWPGTEAAIRAAGDLRGKVLIDCTNPSSQTFRAWSLASPHQERNGSLNGPRERRSSRRSTLPAPTTWPIRSSTASEP